MTGDAEFVVYDLRWHNFLQAYIPARIVFIGLKASEAQPLKFFKTSNAFNEYSEKTSHPFKNAPGGYPAEKNVPPLNASLAFSPMKTKPSGDVSL